MYNLTKNTSFRRFLNIWIQVYKKPNNVTWLDFHANIRNHIPTEVLKLKLFELNPIVIQSVINNVKTSRMRLEIFHILHGSLKTAYKFGLIDKDISELIIKPKHVQKLGSALSDEEVAEFIKQIPFSRCYHYFTFLLYTGCRRSEGLRVRWEDIDFEKRLILIRGTKTKTSLRYVPLNTFLEVQLNMINLPTYAKKGLIFKHRADYVTKEFKRLCPNHKLHDLRHTFATRCLVSGIPIKVVQEWLGHADISTTAKVYTHVTNDFSKNEMEKFKI